MKLSKLGAITQEFDSSDCNHASCPDLAKTISRLTRIPFAPAFAQKTDKAYHGRFASLGQSKPQLLESRDTCLPCCAQHRQVLNSSILFVDDCITSGTTARLCYEALVELGNHVDGLIWVSAGG